MSQETEHGKNLRLLSQRQVLALLEQYFQELLKKGDLQAAQVVLQLRDRIQTLAPVRLFSTSEVAQRLDTTPQNVNRLCKAGILEAILIGHSYVISQEGVEAFSEGGSKSAGRAKYQGTQGDGQERRR